VIYTSRGRELDIVELLVSAPWPECQIITLVFLWVCRRWLIELGVMSDAIRRLDAAASGDCQAADLTPLFYDQLRKLAAVSMAVEVSGEGVTCSREIGENVIFRALQSPTAVVTIL
jgi:hypothetical protein